MIVGLAGYARAGKDTVGQILVEDHGFKRIALADKMKEALAILNPIIDPNMAIELRDAVRLDCAKQPWAPTQHGGIDYETAKYMAGGEVRRLLQVFGTEVGRQLFGPDFWIQQAFKDINWALAENIVVTDVRFPNEVSFINNLGGKVYWVKRPGNKPANSHISELALTPELCDGLIANAGDIEYLNREVKRVIFP